MTALEQFQRVAHRYPYAILIKTFAVWAHTVGADEIAVDVKRYIGPDILAEEDDPEERKRVFLAWVEEIMYEPRVADTHPRLPDETPYDRFIPWVASTLYRLFTRYETTALQYGTDPGDGFYAAEPILKDYFRKKTGVRGELAAAATKQFHTYTDLVVWFSGKLRVLGDWVNAKGRKIEDIKTLDQLHSKIRTARKWAQKEQRKAPVVEGTVLYEYPDGWTMQLLETPESLTYEGGYLRHCIASFTDLGNQEAIYALRDQNRRPVVTIMHDMKGRDSYVEMRVFANDLPGPDLLRRIACFRLENDPPALPYHILPTVHDHSWIEWKHGRGRELGQDEITDALVKQLLEHEIYDPDSVCDPSVW